MNFLFLSVLHLCQDDHHAMDFVTSVANIRAHIFGISLKSGFEIKCRYFLVAKYC